MLVAGFLLGSGVPGFASDQPLWVRQLGTPQRDTANAVTVDGSGHVIVAGSTGGSLGGPNLGSSDAWVAEYDTDGNPVWTWQFGTYQGDSATGVAADGANNVFVAGWTNQEDYYDAFLTKFDAGGTQRWQRVLDSGYRDFAWGVATDQSGNVVVAGSTQGALAGPKKGPTDAWVAKYDNDGHVVWKRQFGTADGTSAQGVATDASGNVFVCGRSGTAVDDVWVTKYDANGHRRWMRHPSTTPADNYATGIATDGTGNVVVVGRTFGALGGQNRGGYDAWLAKYDGGGHRLWKRQIGTPANDDAAGVATDGSGNVFLSGSTQGSLGGSSWLAKYDAAGHLLWTRQLGPVGSGGVAADGSGGVFIAGATDGALDGPNSGNGDAFVAKYSAD